MAAAEHPSDIIDTRDSTSIIDTRGIIDVPHPAPFGIARILGTIEVRVRAMSAWSTTRRP